MVVGLSFVFAFYNLCQNYIVRMGISMCIIQNVISFSNLFLEINWKIIEYCLICETKKYDFFKNDKSKYIHLLNF